MNRMYRSTQHKSLGGVCAGIALSRGWSVSLVRTLALLLLSVSGLGLLLYIACWMGLPSAKTIGMTEPLDLPNDPFQRSVKDRRVAGVCGGLAELLKTDSGLVRVIYVLAVLCGGLGAISYFYAWMIVPERLS